MSTLKFPILSILKHIRSTNPGRYLIFFLIKFPVECRWGPIFVPSYDHIYKNILVCKGKGREEARKEGRKGGREEERKGGREEGRKGGRTHTPL